MKKTEKRFKIRYLVLCLLAVILVGAAVYAGTHWSSVQSVWLGLSTDAEQLMMEQENHKKQIEQELGLDGILDEEQIAAAREEIEAQLAEFEATGILPGTAGTSSELSQSGAESAGQAQTGQSGPVASGQSSGTAGTSGSSQAGGKPGAQSGSNGGASSSPSTTSKPADASAIVSRYTSKLYAVKGVFEGRVNGLVSSAKAEYLALPKEQRTAAKKSAIVYAKMGEAESMEAECDAMVGQILAGLRSELAAAGVTSDAADQLWGYYQEAKISQKAAYISQFRGGG